MVTHRCGQGLFVLADDGIVHVVFYRGCGDEFDEEEPVYSFIKDFQIEDGRDSYRKALRVTD